MDELDKLLIRIRMRLIRLADEAFDPSQEIDSDGYDQAEREGIMMALSAVEDEFASL